VKRRRPVLASQALEEQDSSQLIDQKENNLGATLRSISRASLDWNWNEESTAASSIDEGAGAGSRQVISRPQQQSRPAQFSRECTTNGATSWTGARNSFAV
jgi:hypothetical protein